jgi:hypothetical protein
VAQVEDVASGPSLLEHIPHRCLNASWLREQDDWVHIALHSARQTLSPLWQAADLCNGSQHKFSCRMLWSHNCRTTG